MSNIVTILGDSRTGKDTIKERLLQHNPNARSIKFANPIKRAIAGYLGVEPGLLEDEGFRNTVIPELGCTPLDLLVTSFDVMPKIHPQLGLYATQRELTTALTNGHDVIFTDCRNLVECDLIRKLALDHYHTLIVVKRDVTPKPSDKFIPHITEILLQHSHHQSMVWNNSTVGALEGWADTIVRNIPSWVR